MESYVRGPDVPLPDKTIGQAMEDSAARHPSADAIVSRHQGLRLSYADLREQARRTARGLWGMGLRPGDRVGMWASSCVEWVLLQAATALTGTVLVNVNPANRSRELRYVLRKSRMRALFLHARDARADYLGILAEARGGEDLALERVVVLGTLDWDDMLAAGVEPQPPAAGIDDVVNIQYTSGTTGSPKGVLLTHRNLVNNAWLVARALGAGPGERLCAPVPLYHCFGCSMSSMFSLVSGATLVLPAAQFDARATLEAIHEERCTIIYGVPTMFIAELEHPEFARFDLRSLRTGLMAGAPCPVEVMRRVVEDMHCPEMTVAYGQTEASPAITLAPPPAPLELRTRTIGTALPDTEIRIVAPWDNRPVPVGQPGELCARGYMVMKGYDDDPEATARAVDGDGWLHTGDLATMRPDGYFHITGRLKEMIIRGGENVYPREVEEYLHTHPAVADVYVVGLPDARLGETVLAWIQVKAGHAVTAEEVRDYCRGRIAHFKIPEYIRFVESFPMTVTGKVQKFRIREQEIAERGVGSAVTRTA